jgi:serine/threonine protein kinase
VHLAKLNIIQQQQTSASAAKPGGEKMVAVKMLNLSAPASDRVEFIRECEAMLQLNHANLIALHGVSVRRRPWLCIIELMAYGDIQSVVKCCEFKRITLSVAEQLRICVQVAAGMKYMAAGNWIHMDIAARNFLLGPGLVCKVADFGLTRQVDPTTKQFVQTEKMQLPLKWMAPEAMDGRLWSEASDVWSFGIAMWEIFAYGEIPYAEFKNKECQEKVRGGYRCPIPKSCPNDVYNVMKTCWTHDPAARPAFAELVDVITKTLKPLSQATPERDVGALLAGVPEQLPSFGKKKKKRAKGGTTNDKPTGGPSTQVTAALAQPTADNSSAQGTKVASANGPNSTTVVNPAFDEANMRLRSTSAAAALVGSAPPLPLPSATSTRNRSATVAAVSAHDGNVVVVEFTPDDVGKAVNVVGFENATGVLRFVGPHNETGKARCGVELSTAAGKNNGTVNGHVYFVCKPMHGLLTAPAKVSFVGDAIKAEKKKKKAKRKKGATHKPPTSVPAVVSVATAAAAAAAAATSMSNILPSTTVEWGAALTVLGASADADIDPGEDANQYGAIKPFIGSGVVRKGTHTVSALAHSDDNDDDDNDDAAFLPHLPAPSSSLTPAPEPATPETVAAGGKSATVLFDATGEPTGKPDDGDQAGTNYLILGERGSDFPIRPTDDAAVSDPTLPAPPPAPTSEPKPPRPYPAPAPDNHGAVHSLDGGSPATNSAGGDGIDAEADC